MRASFAIAGVELRRFLKDRSNVFFVFIFPLLLVFLLGLQFGEGASAGRVAVVGDEGDVTSAVVRELESQEIEVIRTGRDQALTSLARGRLDIALMIPANHGDTARPVQVELVSGASASAVLVEQQVRTALAEVATAQRQQQLLTDRGIDSAEAATALARARSEVEPAEIEVKYTDGLAEEFQGMGQFDWGASTQLVLFVFLTTLTASTTMIQARRAGVVSRMLAAPITTTSVIAGMAGSRWLIAMFQGAYIMAATTLFFNVNWGNFWLTLVVLACFSLVAAGAAMLLGTVFDSEGAAAGAGVGIGLVLAALGGAMMPAELFSDDMRTVSWFTPHAWALDAMGQIQRHHGTFSDIWVALVVLSVMASGFLGIGALALRRSISRAMEFSAGNGR